MSKEIIRIDGSAHAFWLTATGATLTVTIPCQVQGLPDIAASLRGPTRDRTSSALLLYLQIFCSRGGRSTYLHFKIRSYLRQSILHLFNTNITYYDFIFEVLKYLMTM